MEMYNVSEHGNADAYLIQGTESSPHLASPTFGQFEAMYNEGAPEFVLEQGAYYPTATNYGYICTGFESPGDWDDHHRILGLDGQEVQFAGAQTENMPYVYYTPSYGYAQSPFNPYNPYIPGAMVGFDGPFIGTQQQYYTVPSYDNHMSSPAYFPMLVQSRPDIISNCTSDPFVDAGSFNSNIADGLGPKHNPSSASSPFTLHPGKPGPNHGHSFTRIAEGAKAIAGPSKQPAAHGSITSGGISSSISSQVLTVKPQTVDNVSHGKALSQRNQLKVALHSNNGLSNLGSSAHVRGPVDKVRPKFNYGRISNDANADALAEQNRGPRINKSKHQLSVKAYTTRAGDSDAQGNIIIYTDRYNKDDFPVDCTNAKFFVIKSYSEDDVHKSIKYNVWSSTPNGNKKLDGAYADAKRVAAGEPKGCPIFLFFSVNASGQFCGVAEMTGPVDFYKDMDFWQQDKWSGSFSVKWHIIKDVPNPNFRHIILENNENKPVTNSRDTQEVRYRPGMEMLKIFKSYTSKTSLLDDFMYYESRQKIMQEERTRLQLIKNFDNNPYLVPHALVEPPPPRKFNHQVVVDLPSTTTEHGKSVNPNNGTMNSLEKPPPVPENETKENNNSSLLKIGSLTINPKKDDEPAAVTTTVVESKGVDVVVTVGSMPVKVNGYAAESPSPKPSPSSGFLTVGTIQLDPRALMPREEAVAGGGFTTKG